MITGNYHAHTYRCHHAEGDIGDYLFAARETGLSRFGFSEHMPLPDNSLNQDHIHMDLDAIPGYVSAVRSAGRHWKHMEVYLGGECDFKVKHTSYFRDELLSRYGFDYLMLAMHYTRTSEGWVMFDQLDTKKRIQYYTEQAIKAMESGLFDCMVHPDIFMVGYQRWDEYAAACSRDLILAAKENNVLLEMNSKGLRLADVSSLKQMPQAHYPHLHFWELAAELQGRAIIGSDAHKPHLAAEKMGLCEELAGVLGIPLTKYISKRVAQKAEVLAT
ncbi:MAG: PHP domain-containing protein [Spirochaetota bacterium]